MSKNHNKRGSVLFKVRNASQLERTLSLCGVVGIKPSINSIMPIIEKRLESEYSNEYGWGSNMLYGCMGEYDYVPPKKSHKNRKKFNKNLIYCNYDEDDYWSNRSTMFNNGEWNDEDYEPVSKVIKFYPSIDNEMNVIEFNSLKSFSDFCDREGYHIGSIDYNNLVNWDVIHCCLDPISLEYGENEVITDNSYGGLYWTVDGDVAKYSSTHDRV